LFLIAYIYGAQALPAKIEVSGQTVPIYLGLLKNYVIITKKDLKTGLLIYRQLCQILKEYELLNVKRLAVMMRGEARTPRRGPARERS